MPKYGHFSRSLFPQMYRVALLDQVGVVTQDRYF